MFYKNWPYWLKFAIVFVLIIVALGAVDYFIETYIINWIPIIFLLMALPGAFILQWLTLGKCFLAIMSPPPVNCFLADNSISFVIIILDIIFYFVVGSIIGKIRNKK